MGYHFNSPLWDRYKKLTEGLKVKIVDEDTSQRQSFLVTTSPDYDWDALTAYDACKRLCYANWDNCKEASEFLANNFALLRSIFPVPYYLHGFNQFICKLYVQVVEVRKETIEPQFSTTLQSKLSSRWQGVKTSVSGLCTTSSANKETYSCLLTLEKMAEGITVRMQPGSGETCTFMVGGFEDELIVEVQDSELNHYGWARVHVTSIIFAPDKKLRWWSIYRKPKHEFVGKVQLHISVSNRLDHSTQVDSVDRNLIYDIVLEGAMKAQHFHQRNLTLHGKWKWLPCEFASHYGVSDAYAKLRYLSHIMGVATPTDHCISLVYDLLLPVMEGHIKSTLSCVENRILWEIKEQIEHILGLVFDNYKSLDEQSPSGVTNIFTPVPRLAASVLKHAVKLYALIHDISSPGAQHKLYSYFQDAAKKRCGGHLTETDEYVNWNDLMDPVAVSTACQKMKSLCLNIRNEILADIEIHNLSILPSFIDLPNLSSAIYSAGLLRRLRDFLAATALSPLVTDLVLATADFLRDLTTWNIIPLRNRVDAKEFFQLYSMTWFEDKRFSLLETCKLDKVKQSGVRTSVVDNIYDRIIETLNDYEAIICEWPEYTLALEDVVADVEKAVVKALDTQYADAVSSLKENMKPKKFGLKYVRRTTKFYVVPQELGILLNSIKRMLDVLHPKIELQLKSWGECFNHDWGNLARGERLSGVTMMLRFKFRIYLQAVVEKLVENARLQNNTKIKKILKDSKESVTEFEISCRMQLLKKQIIDTMNHLHTIFETDVFIATCRGYWDHMGQDALGFFEKRKNDSSFYKVSRVISILDDIFASQMLQLLGNTLEDKDLEPPIFMDEVRSMLCMDAASDLESKVLMFQS